MDCREALPLIHEYLDGDLGGERKEALRLHLKSCTACERLLCEFEQTEALMRALNRPETPSYLTSSIMSALPDVQSNRSFARWIRRHPALTAAAAFLIIMMSTFFSLWNQGTQLVVRGDDLDGIVLENGKVIIPRDKTMDGDLIVENGTVQVDGDLKGDLIVIDGQVALASTAHISGRINKVDRALDYVWFKLNEWFGGMLPQPQT